MPQLLTRSQLQQLRLAAQHLGEQRATGVAALTSALVAIQSQEKPSSILAIRPRTKKITARDVEQALESTRTIIRTWCLRGTLHLIAAADVHWLLPLVAPRLLKNLQRRHRQLGLDDDTLTAATKLFMAALRERGPMTRAELSALLEQNGISAEGQRLPHLIGRAALLGLLCHGPERDGTQTYVLLQDWLEDAPTPVEDGWTKLAARYLATYGPASVDDFATWSGALKKDARAAFDAHRADLIEFEAEGQSLWLHQAQAEALLDTLDSASPGVHLIPAYDPLQLGYQSRDWFVHPQFARQIHPGGGFLRPTLLIDGEAAGTWKLTRRNNALEVTVTPFTEMSSEHLPLLQAEVDDLGRFLDAETTLHIVGM